MVKLNNVLAAREFINGTMWELLKADSTPACPSRPGLPDHLFTLKVVQADKLERIGDLRPTLPNPYVDLRRLPDERILGRTEVFPQSLEPRWGETFDIPLHHELAVRIVMVNRSPGGLDTPDTIIGESRLSLKPSAFDGSTPQNVWIHLSSSGGRSIDTRLLLRVFSDPISDSVAFHLGQGSRILYRYQKKIAQSLVKKVGKPCSYQNTFGQELIHHLTGCPLHSGTLITLQSEERCQTRSQI